MKALKTKRSQKGMTLNELLVALLIFSLVTVAVAAGVGSAVKVYGESTRTSEAQTLCNTLSQAMIDILHGSTAAEDGTLTNPQYGQGVSFAAENGMICLGGKKIVGSGAYTDLSAGVACAYADEIFTVTLTISAVGGEPLTTESFSVRVPG